MLRLLFVLLYFQTFGGEVVRTENVLKKNSTYLQKQEFYRNKLIWNKILASISNAFSFRISYYHLFKQKDVQSATNYFFTFFIPEKKSVEMENIINLEEGQRVLYTYNEYIYYKNLFLLHVAELEEQKQILNKLQVIDKHLHIYDEVIKQEQLIRDLELQISKIGNKINEIKHNFAQNTYNLLEIPRDDVLLTSIQKPLLSNFIVPIIKLDVSKIIYYVNRSFAVQKAYYELKEMNENIKTNINLQTIFSKDGDVNIRINHNPNLHMLDIVLVEVMSKSLVSVYCNTFSKVYNSYCILIALKKLIEQQKIIHLLLNNKIETLLQTKNTKFFLRAIQLKRKLWAIKKSILELQFKQTKYLSILALNIIPLNHMPYRYYYAIDTIITNSFV